MSQETHKIILLKNDITTTTFTNQFDNECVVICDINSIVKL